MDMQATIDLSKTLMLLACAALGVVAIVAIWHAAGAVLVSRKEQAHWSDTLRGSARSGRRRLRQLARLMAHQRRTIRLK